MRRLTVFNSISLDGYFTDASGGMNWAYNSHPDPAWDAFVEGNAKGDGYLLFGRITYDLMASYWPTPAAKQQLPVVAERMNTTEKVVFSRSMKQASWNNTNIISNDIVSELRSMKRDAKKDMVILGSGSIVAQLAAAQLIDEYQFVVIPVVLGGGRTMFDGIKNRLKLQFIDSRVFANGNVFLRYKPAGQ